MLGRAEARGAAVEPVWGVTYNDTGVEKGMAVLEETALTEELCEGTKTGIEENRDNEGIGDGFTIATLGDERLAAKEDGLAEDDEGIEELIGTAEEGLAEGEGVAIDPLGVVIANTVEEACGEDVGTAVGVIVLVLQDVVGTPLLI